MLCLHPMSVTAALFPIGQVECLSVDQGIHNVYTTGEWHGRGILAECWCESPIKVGSKENMGQGIKDRKHSPFFCFFLSNNTEKKNW